MIQLKTKYVALATSLLLAACGSESLNQGSEAKVNAIKSLNGTNHAANAEKMQALSLGTLLEQEWMIMDPAFRAANNCIQLVESRDSSIVEFSGATCPITGRAVTPAFSLIATPIAAGTEKGVQTKVAHFSLMHKTETAIETQVGAFEIHQGDVVEAKLTDLCSGAFAKVCKVNLKDGVLVGIERLEGAELGHEQGGLTPEQGQKMPEKQAPIAVEQGQVAPKPTPEQQAPIAVEQGQVAPKPTPEQQVPVAVEQGQVAPKPTPEQQAPVAVEQGQQVPAPVQQMPLPEQGQPLPEQARRS